MTNQTIVLVHGAFAESSSWNGVVSELLAQGYPVIAVANPLRGAKIDADYTASVLASIDGPIVLVGHSYGGLFTSWVAFTSPTLFSHYLIVSPSLWYDGRFMFGLEEAFSKKHRELPARMFFSVGANEGNAERDMVRDLERFARQVERRGYAGLTTHAHVFDDENHNSVFPSALSRGLRFLHGL